MADALGGWSCRPFLDGNVHQRRAICNAGWFRKIVVGQPLLESLRLSVLNDVGMLLACGVIKKISCEAVTARLSTAKVDLAVAPVFDSKAYDEDGKSDSDSDEMYMVGCRA